MRTAKKLKLKSFHHIVDDQGRIVMAEGRMALLEAIVETGSINRAAQKMGMSYKTAWSKIRSSQEHLNARIVISDKVSGTRLTPVGEELLSTYRQMKKQCLRADDDIFDAFFQMVEKDGRLKSQSGPPIISFVGHSGSGKTTLIEKLIPELTMDDIRVGIIKHDVHGFEMDKPGKDTWRHKRAGAAGTLISSPSQIGMVLDTDHDHQPHELAPLLGTVDLIIVEGFKRGNQPKIEVFRPEATGDAKPLCHNDAQLTAIVTDAHLNVDLPVFGLDDIQSLAAFLRQHFHLPAASEAEP